MKSMGWILTLWGVVGLAVLHAQITTFPYVENFDTGAAGTMPPAGWVNVTTDAGGLQPQGEWTFAMPPVASLTSGPTVDFSDPANGSFAYVDQDGGFATVELLSPIFDVSALGHPTLDVQVWRESFSIGDTIAMPTPLRIYAESAVDPSLRWEFPPLGENFTQNWALVRAEIAPWLISNSSGQIRIRFSVDNSVLAALGDVAIDAFTLFDADRFNIAGTRIVAPLAPCGATAGPAEMVTVEYTNLGQTIVGGGATQVTVSTNFGSFATEMVVLPDPFLAGASFLHTFSTPLDLSQSYVRLRALHFDLRDAVSWDGGAVAYFNAPAVNAFPYTENFDVLPVGWENVLHDQSGPGLFEDWILSYPAGLAFGPAFDHTGGGRYAILTDLGNGDDVGLLTPCFDLTGTASPQASFWVHSEIMAGMGTGVGNSLRVDILDGNTGAVLLPSAVGTIGALGSNWVEVTLNLSAYVGSVIQLRFGGDVFTLPSSTIVQSLAIDDFQMVDLGAAIGQAPTPQEAVLDVNGALNASVLPVSSGAPGPYATQVSIASGSLVVALTGAPHQPFLLAAGELSVGVTSAQPLGQFDIGLTPMAGVVPDGLTVVWDGLSPGLGAILYRFDANGLWSVSLPVPAAPGLVIGLQAITLVPGPQIARLSNAVNLAFF